MRNEFPVKRSRVLFWLACALIGSASVASGQEKCDEPVREIEAIQSELNAPEGTLFPKESAFIAGEFDAQDLSLGSDENENQLEPNSNLPSSGEVQGYVQTPLRQIGLSLSADLQTPELKPAPRATGNSYATGRTVKHYQWTAPNDVYQCLMFEDPLLERHGVSNCPQLQPVVSGVKFLKSGFLYPLDAFKGYHKRCDNPLGWGTLGNYCR